MKICPLCKEAAGFRVKLTDDGAQQTCLGCKAVIPASIVVDDDEAEESAVVYQATARAKPKPARGGLDLLGPDKSSPLDIIRATKQRLKFINIEIKRLEKLKAERDQLTRLLDAAKAEKHQKIEAAVTRLVPRQTAGSGRN